VGGRTTKKKLSNDGSLEATYGWDNEGKMTWVKYPDTCEGDPYHCTWVTGRTYTYGFDGMGRPITLTDDSPGNTGTGSSVHAPNNGLGQSRPVPYFLQQLTQLTAPGVNFVTARL
jgi:hypothetical protein